MNEAGVAAAINKKKVGKRGKRQMRLGRIAEVTTENSGFLGRKQKYSVENLEKLGTEFDQFLEDQKGAKRRATSPYLQVQKFLGNRDLYISIAFQARKSNLQIKPKRISDLLTKEQIQTEDANEILLEKGVMKYKPGFQVFMHRKWLTASKSCIKYYKSEWSAHCWMEKPLVCIPFKYIESIQR